MDQVSIATTHKKQAVGAKDATSASTAVVVDPPTLGVLAETDAECMVDEVLRFPSDTPVLRRFAMADMVDVDARSVALMKASSSWKTLLPHVERVVEDERVSVAAGATTSFVARTLRKRPGVVYAVRYWTGLADQAALAAALGEVRGAWSVYQHLDLHPNQVENIASKGLVCSASSSVEVGMMDHRLEPRDEAQSPIDNGKEPLDVRAPPPVRVGTANGSARSDTRCAGPDNKNSTQGDGMAQVLASLPESTRVSRRSQQGKRNPILKVLGFAVDLDNSSKTARAALVAEWPGIGSLHDVLQGKAVGVGGVLQEDLLRWTRQAAEALVQISRYSRSSLSGGHSSVAPTLRFCARNIYLFARPKDNLLSEGGAEILDARVAPFFGPCAARSPRANGHAVLSLRNMLPPEDLWDIPDAVVPIPTLSSNKSRIGDEHGRREAADVWGMGILVFELATGQVAGLTPLASRPLRDLLRDVPIDPRFIYGDVARGVMRLALRGKPRDRARAVEIAAAVEDIVARTLRRAHTASDRQERLLREQRRIIALRDLDGDRKNNGMPRKDEDSGGDDDGYGQAVIQWKIREAVERAGGRARAFLRQLWFDSLSENDKRRIRHRRSHRKANKKAREWRDRRVRAAGMCHWTPVQVADWISHLLLKAERSHKLPLLFSADAKGGIFSMASIEPAAGDQQAQNQPTGNSGPHEETVVAEAQPTSNDKGVRAAPVTREATSAEDGSTTVVDSVVEGVGGGFHGLLPDISGEKETGREGLEGRGEGVNSSSDGGPDPAGNADCDNSDDREDGDNDGDDDDSSSLGGATDDNDWAAIEAGERKGYAGVAVEALAVAGGASGLCVMEAMDGALGHANDALTRFVRSSTRLPRPDEVEQKRVELMVRELLTIRPYSTPSQLTVRSLAVAIVRKAEAPRELMEEQIDAQLPHLARVLTAGYRHQASLAEQGLDFAAARIQGLARGARVRRVVSSIWSQAEEYALNIVRGEREARIKQEAEWRAKAKEEALEREREDARRYRMRLVPRVSSVTCASMNVSLPPFIVAAASGSRRFLVMDTTFIPPPSPASTSPLLDQAARDSSSHGVGHGEAHSSSVGCAFARGGHGRIHVLLRQGSAMELMASLDAKLPSTSDDKTPDGAEESRNNSQQVPTRFVRAVADALWLGDLRPCTTYRLSLELPPLVRNDLLESARELGLAEAVRSLEASGHEREPDEGDGGGGLGLDQGSIDPANAASVESSHNVPYGGESETVAGLAGSTAPSSYVDVDTLPDVPGVLRHVTCKVLTSASAADPRDPGHVLPLRQWLSPYPGIANMDASADDEYLVLAPGRPEPIVSLHWNPPESNGLEILSYFVERRLGPNGRWKEINHCGGDVAWEKGGRGEKRAPDTMDAPLRSLTIEALRKVAAEGLVICYRVYAVNTLGNGAPSGPVEVNLQAFLGHLRSHAGGPMSSAVRPTIATKRSAPPGQTSPQSRSPPPTSTSVGQQRGGSPNERGGSGGEETRNSAGTPPSPQTPGALGADFMGLSEYGEGRVHGLFNPLSTRSSSARLRRRRAPAAEGGKGGETRIGNGVGGVYPLPPIVVVSGISGAAGGKFGVGAPAAKHAVGRTQDGVIGGRDCGDGRDVPAAELGNRSEFFSGGNRNDVFHAFLNLGRRLPGRLRRDNRDCAKG